MMMRGYVGVALLIFALAACAAKPAVQEQSPELGTVSPAPAVQWQGHELREVTSLAALPALIRKTLRVDRPGVDGVADRGQPFSSSDIVIGERPMRRFITAGQDGSLWLVVIEHGGIAPGVMAFQFSGGMLQEKWMLPLRPGSLADAVRFIPTQGSKPSRIVPAAPSS